MSFTGRQMFLIKIRIRILFLTHNSFAVEKNSTNAGHSTLFFLFKSNKRKVGWRRDKNESTISRYSVCVKQKILSYVLCKAAVSFSFIVCVVVQIQSQMSGECNILCFCFSNECDLRCSSVLVTQMNVNESSYAHS